MTITGKRIDKERVETDAKVSGLGNFKAEEFEAAGDGFHNLLYQKTGMTKADLRYIIYNRVVPEVFPDAATEQMYQIRIYGQAFGEVNRKCFRMIREYLNYSPGWACIGRFYAMENGCEVFWDWSNHYNGQGKLSKRNHLSLDTLKTLHYKREQSMAFDRYS